MALHNRCGNNGHIAKLYVLSLKKNSMQQHGKQTARGNVQCTSSNTLVRLGVNTPIWECKYQVTRL